MADIILITDLELTKGSPLGGNIDIDKYRNVIKETQIFVIEVILGTKLYNKILTDFDAGTITGVYSTILTDYIKPILINYVAAEYITIAGFEVNNAGIIRRTPEGTTPASSTDISKLSSRYRSKAEVYEERLQRYLQDQKGNIVEYTYSQDNNFDLKPDNDVNLIGGWRLSKSMNIGTNAEREIWRDIYYDNGKA